MAIRVFNLSRFKNQFPVFASDTSVYNDLSIQRAGNEALHYISEPVKGLPLEHCDDREYALFLLTAHILVVNAGTESPTASGEATSGGQVVSSTVGSVKVEHTKPNSFTTDDWSYWLSQTEYGRRLIAFLDFQVPFIYHSTARDSVRVLI